jgi:hypothetical protein
VIPASAAAWAIGNVTGSGMGGSTEDASARPLAWAHVATTESAVFQGSGTGIRYVVTSSTTPRRGVGTFTGRSGRKFRRERSIFVAANVPAWAGDHRDGCVARSPPRWFARVTVKDANPRRRTCAERRSRTRPSGPASASAGSVTGSSGPPCGVVERRRRASGPTPVARCCPGGHLLSARDRGFCARTRYQPALDAPSFSTSDSVVYLPHGAD